jgi:hypothetical protein
MMHTEPNLTRGVVPADAGAPADESGAALLGWMEELEASLLGSHSALLALDLAGIERGTTEQADLIGKFVVRRQAVREQSADGLFRVPADAPGLARELRHRAMRILYAARLQSALLARSQTKLRVLANMLAGPSVDYGPLLLSRGRQAHVGWQVRL